MYFPAADLGVGLIRNRRMSRTPIKHMAISYRELFLIRFAHHSGLCTKCVEKFFEEVGGSVKRSKGHLVLVSVGDFYAKIGKTGSSHVIDFALGETIDRGNYMAEKPDTQQTVVTFRQFKAKKQECT